MTKQTFLQGAIILIIAGMITRFLGFINRIVVARLMGEEGVGLYMMALPTLFLVITLTQMGLPVAIAKRVAEAEATGSEYKVKRILIISLLLTGSLSILFTIAMLLGAPILASSLLTDDRTLYPLLAITPIIPIVAISSVLRGYFQGKQNMKPQSIAQVIEQVVRIVFVFIFVQLLLPFGVEFAAAGAMLSVILGELASVLFMLYQFNLRKAKHAFTHLSHYMESKRETLHSLLSIALPSTGSRLIGSISNFLEPILVSQSLAIAGISSAVATGQYGELTGYVIPLLFLPTFITQSLAIALIPTIAEADATNQRTLIHYRIDQAIRISYSSGALATIILLIFSKDILQLMYQSTSGSELLMTMAPFFILLYIQAPLQAALQALDLAKESMWNSLIGAIVKLIIIFFLASNPIFGITGVAIAISVSVILITLLHLAVLKKKLNFSISLIDLIKMMTLFATTLIAGSLLQQIIGKAFSPLLTVLTVLIILTAIYIFLLFVLRMITKEELKTIPFIKQWIR